MQFIYQMYPLQIFYILQAYKMKEKQHFFFAGN